MWPKDVRCALSLTFDLDIETPWLVKNPGIATRPGALSLAHYAPRVAVPLILSLLERLEVEGTFFIPGKVDLRVGERLQPASVVHQLTGVYRIPHSAVEPPNLGEKRVHTPGILKIRLAKLFP